MTGTFTFVHAADVHLDSPLSGLGRKNEAFAQLVRGATRRAFSNVVDLAIDEGADFVVVSGDLYDGTWKDHATGQFAVRQFARLARAGIRSFIIYGNHDAESRVTRHLALPEGVHAFDNRQCETVDLADLGVAIHGRSYKEAATFENIASTYCPPTPGRFNLPLLHTALEGHAAHTHYAPCTIDELVASGHDYWALGHVHEPSVRGESPYIVYPGNTQGRSVREIGPKGAMLVRVADGIVRSIEPRACDEARWARLRIDASGASNMTELLSGVRRGVEEELARADGRPMAVRLQVEARGELASQLLADGSWFEAEAQNQATIAGEGAWIEKVTIETSHNAPLRGLPPELAELFAQALDDPDCMRAVQEAAAPILLKLPVDAIDSETAPLVAAAKAQDGAALVAAARAAVAAKLDFEAS